MPYTREWDESSPPGTAPANTLDTIIQNFKTDMRERLAQVIVGWSDEDVDPKAIKLHAGNAASRPSTDLEAGQVYFSTDTSVVEVWSGSEWITIEGSTGGGGGGGTSGPTSTVYTFTINIATLADNAPNQTGPYVWKLADDVSRNRKLREIRYRMRKDSEAYANYWGVFPGSIALSPDEASSGDLSLVLEQLNIDPAGVPFSLDATTVDWTGVFYFYNNLGTQNVHVEVLLDLWDV